MSERKHLIKLYAKELRLPSFARYEQLAREAEKNGYAYEEFLLRLMQNELENRQENKQKYRIKQAKFPSIKSLDTFEFANLLELEPARIWQLAECNYLEHRENIVFIGNPGTGKTHLASGLALMACQKGYRVRFYTAATLANDLLEAKEQRTLSRLEKQLDKIQLLVLDELSYLTFSRPSAELLFQVISNRNERGSTIITTNLEFSRWTEIFADPLLTSAIVDRMTHRSHIIDTNGSSYRLKQRLTEAARFTGND